MNRIVLVGNGFDLAHGFKTSYNDFIDDFWSKECSIINANEVIYNHSNDLFYFESQEPLPTKNISNYKQLKNLLKRKNIEIVFENVFLKAISDKGNLQHWVDLENEYYDQLKDLTSPIIIDENYSIEILNNDFEDIKELLVDYLKKINFDVQPLKEINKNLYSSIRLTDLESMSRNQLIDKICNYCENEELDNLTSNEIIFRDSILKYKTFSKNLKDNYFTKNFDSSDEVERKFLRSFYKPAETLILNFNYTNTVSKYNHSNTKIINIHGKLDSELNPIIFGFGDDLDRKYQDFEDLNDNRFLRNFKSIAYLQTDNYKKLLEFINLEEFQVFIFGHSCGTSDRTMLNTIFEHDNCKSIKPFYHKKEDGSDNYTDLVQNISRNFNNKKKFRDRVVNKTYCESLT